LSKLVVRFAFILLLALGNSSLSPAKVAGHLGLTLEPTPGDSEAVCALAAACFVVLHAKVSNTTSRAVEITSLRIHNETLPLSRRERD